LWYNEELTGGSFFLLWKKILNLLSNNVEGVLHIGEASLEEQRNMEYRYRYYCSRGRCKQRRQKLAVEMVL
jgi:hypothetical protein